MRRDQEFLGVRKAFREASGDYERVLARIESRTVCATCAAGSYFDVFGESTNRDCAECDGQGWHQVISSGVFPAIIEILRGTQRYETKEGVLHAGNAVLHAEVGYSGFVESAYELEFQGVKWQPVEVTRTPFARALWLTVPCRRKE